MLLSKKTVKIIEIICGLIQQLIAGEVSKAGMFSIQLDTTQDITSKEQCALVLRYVTDLVHEKLIAVVNCEASTGEHFVKMVKDSLENVGLDLQKCIGNTTDGAANMQGKYKGFSTLLSAESPQHVHTWCYAHVLNLVLTAPLELLCQVVHCFYC